MHELAVTENLLNIAMRHATQAGAVRVTSLQLVIGQLSSIVDDSVQFYWDMFSVGTLCEGAQLRFERRPALLKCLDCDQTYTLCNELTDCPHCHSVRLKIMSGEEFYLDSIEVEAESALAPTACANPAQAPSELASASLPGSVNS
jgi:hydrogenase nickel incorporation protein HypA/HybF